MDTRHHTSESERGISASLATPSSRLAARGEKFIKWNAQTRQGCFAVTERNINRSTDNRTWIRFRDGIAGTRKYTDDLNTEWQGPFSVQVGQKP